MGKKIKLLEAGTQAPEFSAVTNGGNQVKLSDFIGQPVILYFYPKDDTPGCTKEACAFRDDYKQFKKKKAVILGVSADSVKKHDRFIEKYDLPFTLLADEDRAIVKAYGVWGEKKVHGSYLRRNSSSYLSHRCNR